MFRVFYAIFIIVAALGWGLVAFTICKALPNDNLTAFMGSFACASQVWSIVKTFLPKALSTPEKEPF